MKRKIALAISGGGYRATLYALGSIWRLNEFGLLQKLKTITSVSGGSITSAWLGLNWNDLEFSPEDNVAANFEDVIARPLEVFCTKGIDIKAGIGGIFSFKDTIGDKVAKAYDKHLFKKASLDMIPNNAPEFIFYGTNYQTGSGFQISKNNLHDYKIGDYPTPDISISKVVAISSAFPPVLSPVQLQLDPSRWIKGPYSKHFDDTLIKSKLILTDGGLYDNLGLEKIWKGEGGYSHILACDAGAPLTVTEKIKTNWAGQLMRMTEVMTDQQRALRKRQLINNFKSLDQDGNHTKYGGTYFGIATRINKYELNDPMTSDNEKTSKLKMIRTRLNKFKEKEQGQLINWGYALTDSAIRRYVSDIVDTALCVQGAWPKKKYPL